MTGQEVIITRGIVTCKHLGGAHIDCIKFLYVALSPTARKKLTDIFTLAEIDMLEQFVAENYAAIEKEGYSVGIEKTEGKPPEEQKRI